MDAERWRRAADLFASAVARPPAERGAFLDEACSGNGELRADVDSLLAHDRDDAFLAAPAVEEVASALAAADSRVGRRIGRFDVIERLGAGGMGEVYLAMDPKLERRVALKLVRRDLAGDPDRARRFRREALAASALNHPNILTVHEVDSADGADLLVSELVDGVTLRERLREGPLPVETALEVALQAARGLAAAHAAGIVHRDVKPENLMIRRDGLVKVLDFGVAKAVGAWPAGGGEARTQTTAGAVIGTLSYMSPEQARGLPVDARTDVWSLGVVLYEMTTGETPFRGETPSDRLVAILQHEPELPSARRGDLPGGLDRVVARALSKEPAARQADAGELAAELEELLAAGAGTAAVPGARVETGRGRGRRFVLAASALGILTVAGLGTWLWRGAAASPRLDSLAVLPLAHAGGDPELDYLAEGIADGVIRALARTPDLRVVARWSSFRYDDGSVPARQVGRELGVSGVVAGRVARRGERTLVSLELIDARDDSHVWGREYELDPAALVTVHEEVAGDIRRSLGVEPVDGGAHLAAARAVDPEAYRLYLRGRYAWGRQATDYHASRDLFQRAIERDPDFALAWAGLSHYYSFGAANGLLPPGEYWPRAEQTGRRAVELDPGEPEAYNALAGVPLYRDHDWRRGEELLDRGLALGESAELLNHSTHYLGVTRRTARALRMRERSRAVDPGRDPYRHAMVLYFARRDREAEDAARRAVELDPSNATAQGTLGNLLAGQGREAEAAAVLAVAYRAFDPRLGELFEREYAGSGLRAARAELARRRLAALEGQRAAGGYVAAFEMARQHLLAGDGEQAIAWAQKAFGEPNRFVLVLAADPLFDPLRDDPRFRAGVASLRLPRPD